MLDSPRSIEKNLSVSCFERRETEPDNQPRNRHEINSGSEELKELVMEIVFIAPQAPSSPEDVDHKISCL